MTNTACEHDYQEVAAEAISEPWQDMSIGDDDMTGPELIDRANGDTRYLVTYRCTKCGEEYQDEEI
ncbi:TPA: hypothetical protein ACGW3W_002176 [Pseudomonas aeruginosa]